MRLFGAVVAPAVPCGLSSVALTGRQLLDLDHVQRRMLRFIVGLQSQEQKPLQGRFRYAPAPQIHGAVRASALAKSVPPHLHAHDANWKPNSASAAEMQAAKKISSHLLALCTVPAPPDGRFSRTPSWHPSKNCAGNGVLDGKRQHAPPAPRPCCCSRSQKAGGTRVCVRPPGAQAPPAPPTENFFVPTEFSARKKVPQLRWAGRSRERNSARQCSSDLLPRLHTHGALPDLVNASDAAWCDGVAFAQRSCCFE